LLNTNNPMLTKVYTDLQVLQR